MIKKFMNSEPVIADGCFIADNSTVTGKVTVGENSSVWFGAVLRGDMCPITIGKNSNVQDNAVVHVGISTPAVIGDGVTIGHGAIVHGAKIGNNVLVGMGSIVLDGAVIGDNSIIGAGAVVTANSIIPENSLVLGTPGKVVKTVSDAQINGNRMNAMSYSALAKNFKKEQDAE